MINITYKLKHMCLKLINVTIKKMLILQKDMEKKKNHLLSQRVETGYLLQIFKIILS